MIEIEIAAADAGRRFDKFLAQYLNTAPKSFIYKMLRKKRIKLNGARAEGHEITQTGDRVVFYLSQETLDGCMAERAVVQAAPRIDLVYEDDALLLVNKPAGLLMHPGRLNETDTMVSRVLFYLQQTGVYDVSKFATFTPAACNRLDRNTSGLVVFGKTLHAVQTLNAAFASRATEKYYLAVVQGRLTGAGRLAGFLRKDEARNTVQIANETDGDDASVITDYEALQTNGAYTFVRVRLVTGKSHQIRAHLAGMGHPIAGDRKYGGDKTAYGPAQLLHSYALALTGTNRWAGQRWYAPLPGMFRRGIRDWFGEEAFTNESDYSGGGVCHTHVSADP